MKLLAVITTLLIGFALTAPISHAKPAAPVTMILVGGNGDSTGGNLENGLRANGWIPPGAQHKSTSSRSPTWRTLLAERLPLPTPRAKIVAAYTANCLAGAKCELHGSSAGTNPVIRASQQLGVPNGSTRVVLHGSPNPVTGAWHSLNDQSFVDAFDPYSASFTVKEVPRTGTEHWYHQDDYAANKAPQCFNNSAIFYMGTVFNSGVHWIQPKSGAHDVWTGPDGVINNEFGAGASTLTVSGNSPVKPTCPTTGWYR